MYGSEIWGIDCNDKLDKDPEELVQNKLLKWLLGVNFPASKGSFPGVREHQEKSLC